jgi:hypothetical protein
LGDGQRQYVLWLPLSAVSLRTLLTASRRTPRRDIGDRKSRRSFSLEIAVLLEVLRVCLDALGREWPHEDSDTESDLGERLET